MDTVRITRTSFLLLLAVGGALVVATPPGARAQCTTKTTTTTTTTTTTMIACDSATAPKCAGSCASAGKVCADVVGKGCECVSASMPTCEIGLCVAEGDLCEPCVNGFGRLGSPGAGSCARTIEGDLRCQTGGCLQPASNCTSSAQCPGDQFCGPYNGVNYCCPLCQPVLEVPIICSAQGDQCGKLVGEFGGRYCRTGPGIYDEGFCQPSVEGDFQCQVLGCLSTTCTSSGECGSGFFCGRDAGGSGVNLCCPLCH